MLFSATALNIIYDRVFNKSMRTHVALLFMYYVGVHRCTLSSRMLDASCEYVCLYTYISVPYLGYRPINVSVPYVNIGLHACGVRTFVYANHM